MRSSCAAARKTSFRSDCIKKILCVLLVICFAVPLYLAKMRFLKIKTVKWPEDLLGDDELFTVGANAPKLAYRALGDIFSGGRAIKIEIPPKTEIAVVESYVAHVRCSP